MQFRQVLRRGALAVAVIAGSVPLFSGSAHADTSIGPCQIYTGTYGGYGDNCNVVVSGTGAGEFTLVGDLGFGQYAGAAVCVLYSCTGANADTNQGHVEGIACVGYLLGEICEPYRVP